MQLHEHGSRVIADGQRNEVQFIRTEVGPGINRQLAQPVGAQTRLPGNFGAVNRTLRQMQLFIRLCLRYDFSYERIAYYLGGISDYDVSLRVEQCISHLKAALADTSRLDRAASSSLTSLEAARTAAGEGRSDTH